ncbi:NUDIX hydrolase [Flavicella marina]|uniref:NUDIX hydrolase n=1 Tax=Flavicella marina TaxID=1475951 RepID=UPI001265582A|nr:NUDIX domain-containing protein [Flavicella marina]
MDEYIELLDNDNKPSGEKCLKSIAHQKGLYHASVHIWFYTSNKQLLVQQRHPTKDTFPNLWDVSVAGHIAYKERPKTAAIREIEEEIGLTIEENELRNIGTSTHKNQHANGIIDHELHHIYICKLNAPLENLTIQQSEVSKIKLIPLDVLKFELKNNTSQYVPHGELYYNRIFNAINQFA